MIKIERVSVMNLENAIRGARNPMNSWGRMDSEYDSEGNYILGENDLDLARRLARAGSDHRKFLRQIFVSVDITAPLYWWKEFDTYKVGTVANSCSTMHKIHSKPFEREDFSCDRLDEAGLEALDALIVFLEAERIIAVINPGDALYYNAEWKSDNENVILVSPTGYARCIGEGKATVYLTVENTDGTLTEGKIIFECKLNFWEKAAAFILKDIIKAFYRMEF